MVSAAVGIDAVSVVVFEVVNDPLPPKILASCWMNGLVVPNTLSTGVGAVLPKILVAGVVGAFPNILLEVPKIVFPVLLNVDVLLSVEDTVESASAAVVTDLSNGSTTVKYFI